MNVTRESDRPSILDVFELITQGPRIPWVKWPENAGRLLLPPDLWRDFQCGYHWNLIMASLAAPLQGFLDPSSLPSLSGALDRSRWDAKRGALMAAWKDVEVSGIRLVYFPPLIDLLVQARMDMKKNSRARASPSPSPSQSLILGNQNSSNTRAHARAGKDHDGNEARCVGTSTGRRERSIESLRRAISAIHRAPASHHQDEREE